MMPTGRAVSLALGLAFLPAPGFAVQDTTLVVPDTAAAPVDTLALAPPTDTVAMRRPVAHAFEFEVPGQERFRPPPTLIQFDPPVHGEQRKLIRKRFTPRALDGHRVEPEAMVSLRPKGGLPMRLVARA